MPRVAALLTISAVKNSTDDKRIPKINTTGAFYSRLKDLIGLLSVIVVNPCILLLPNKKASNFIIKM
ncbi:MAG: hypothetical protein WCD89_12525 [Anaerocolumna sp.]